MDNETNDSPWNPNSPVQVTPEEYEQEVLCWLKEAGALQGFETAHRRKLRGHDGGEYEFDIVVELSVLEGARIVVLVECKRLRRPVERDMVVALYGKLREVAAHKAIMFSASGFQSGALEYAAAHGIATVSFIDGKSIYSTRAMSPVRHETPSWLNLPKFAGALLRIEQGVIHRHLVDHSHLDTLVKWLGLSRPNKRVQPRV